MYTRAPLDTLDIGQPWSRWLGEPNFENGKLVCPVSTFIRSFGLSSFLSRVGSPVQPTGPKKRREPRERRGTMATVTFSIRVQSVSSHWTHDTGYSYSRFFATIGRSVASRKVRLGIFRKLAKSEKRILRDDNVCSRIVKFLLKMSS